MSRIINLFLMLVLMGCTKGTNDEKFTILFGELDGQESYTLSGDEFAELTTVKKSKDYKFGFIITAKTKKPFKYYTISYLPNAPKVLTGTLKDEALQKFSAGVKSSEDTAESSVAIPFWFDEGDPDGTYKIDLYINDVKERSVVFNVR